MLNYITFSGFTRVHKYINDLIASVDASIRMYNSVKIVFYSGSKT